MNRNDVQEINAGSMADIAFLLLIFFLVAATIETDTGILRKLPPMVDVPPTEVRERNILKVLVNKNNELMVNGRKCEFNLLKEKATEFILNEHDDPYLPVIKEEEFDYFGKVKVTKNHLISLQSDRGTSYGTYIIIQNELTAAYNELRNELAMEKWRTPYEDLPKDKQKIIASIYSMKISEAEPNR